MQSKGGFKRAIARLDRYFPETMELVLAATLLFWGIVTLVPVELLPGSIYIYNAAKIPFGILLSFPGAFLIWSRVRRGSEQYSAMTWRRRQCLLFISTGFIYLAVLSASVSIWPPRFGLYLALAILAILCYMRLIIK